jgi:hypothetical protein
MMITPDDSLVNAESDGERWGVTGFGLAINEDCVAQALLPVLASL